MYTICPDIIFQILLPCSRPMISHHVTCHVTSMSHASSSSIKEKEIQKKRDIKSRKIDKRKRKMLVSKTFHNTTSTLLIKLATYFVLIKSLMISFIIVWKVVNKFISPKNITISSNNSSNIITQLSTYSPSLSIHYYIPIIIFKYFLLYNFSHSSFLQRILVPSKTT